MVRKTRQADLTLGSLPRIVREPSHSSVTKRKHGKVSKLQKLRNTARAFLSANTSSAKDEDLFEQSAVHKVQKSTVIEESDEEKDNSAKKRKIKAGKERRNEAKPFLTLNEELEDEKSSSSVENDELNSRVEESSSPKVCRSKAKKGANIIEVLQVAKPSRKAKKLKAKKPIGDFMKQLATNSCIPHKDYASEETVADIGENFQQIYTCNGCWIVAFTRTLEVRGFVEVSPLQGDVEIHGYSLEKGDSIKAFSPPGYYNSLLINQTIHAGFSSEVFSQFLGPRAVENLSTFAATHRRLAVVRLSPLEPPEFARPIFRLPNDTPGYMTFGNGLAISEEVSSSSYNAQTLEAVELLKRIHVQGYQDMRVIVCGGMHVGKSTLIKFIINKLLSQKCCKNGVVHMDCDPGQTEFAQPGCLSLHRVKSPLLGPAWLNEINPDHSELVGSTCPDADVDHYVRCVSQLISKYETKYHGHPLLVNTMGWISGLGLHFLSAIVSLVQPTHILQIGVDQRFPAFSRVQAHRHGLFLDAGKRQTLNELDYNVIALEPSSPPKHQLKRGERLTPANNRELKVLSYFSRLSPSRPRILDVTPHSVSWSRIVVSLGSDVIEPHLILRTLNGSIVALCRGLDVKSTLDEPTGLCISSGFPGKLLGLGLIRAVDPLTRTFYIVTPLEADVLDKVNVFIRVQGNLTPKSLIVTQATEMLPLGDSAIPHLDVSLRVKSGFARTGKPSRQERERTDM